MKTIISVLLGALVCLVSCDKEVGPSPYPPFGPTMLDLLFVDETGGYLVDNLPLRNLPGYQLPPPVYLHVDPMSYRFSVTINGQKFNEKETFPCEASLINGRFRLITGANWVGLFDQVIDGQDSIYVYEITFACPGIYGDESEHVLKLERKHSNAGLTNNCERLFHDGKLIASGEEGARPPGPDTPFVIVVPQK